MSSLTTVPEELAAAAAQLQAIVSSLAAQNAGAAAATTVIAPAAADPVSIRQAGIFSAYGTTYQTAATQSQTTQENYTTTLGQSSGTYSSAEASNAANNSLQALQGGTNASSNASPNSVSLGRPLQLPQWQRAFPRERPLVHYWAGADGELDLRLLRLHRYGRRRSA